MFIPGEQLRWLSDTIRCLHTARTYAELQERIVPRLHDRFSSIVSVCESASHDGSQFSTDRMAGSIAVPPDYALYLWDHPNVIRLLNGARETVLHLRETTGARTYERTDYFNALCRHNSIHDQILTVVWHERRLTSFGINRDRVFSESDRCLLGLLQPHLAAGLRRVGAHDEAKVAPFGAPWIELGPDLRPVRLTPAQARVLGSYFPGWRTGRRSLPAAMDTWLHDCQRRLAGNAGPRPICALQVECPRGRLAVRYFPAEPERRAALRLTETPAELTQFWSRTGLTAREREVLDWIGQGKRDAEIALILGIAPDTVSKHIERVLQKLGVKNRTAAASALRPPH